MADLICINYRELSSESADSQNLPSLRDSISAHPQNHEAEIALYLENAPAYSGVGKIVGDVLDTACKAVLFPGTRTDGLYAWPAELPYYVRKYHLRLPQDLIVHMASLDWQPPAERNIDWEKCYQGTKIVHSNHKVETNSEEMKSNGVHY